MAKADPFRGFNFKVQIQGTVAGGFQECGGLDSTTAPIEYREGDDMTNHVRKIRGLNTFSAITLKRGISDSTVLYDWYKKGDRRSGSIILMDENNETKIQWDFHNAWPSKWVGPAFNATSNALAIETVEITHEELVRA